jgi:hypothetical protein
MTVSRIRLVAVASFLLIALALIPTSTNATHSWGGYHWARTSNPFSLNVGDNLNSTWKPHLKTTIADWSKSTVLDLVAVPGGSNKRCSATAGRIEVCNNTYGKNGWLGLAQIWLSNGHISQGTAKMNDTYFNLPAYNNDAERNHVMCQEVGHTFGLGHQDESGAALGTCMDYSSDAGSQHPNTHDYDMLKEIYSHLDSSAAAPSADDTNVGKDVDLNNPREWGQAVKEAHAHGGKPSLYVRDFGNGRMIFTFVVWADTK